MSSKFIKYSVSYMNFSEKKMGQESAENSNTMRQSQQEAIQAMFYTAQVRQRLITHSLGTDNHSPLAGMCRVLRI